MCGLEEVVQHFLYSVAYMWYDYLLGSSHPDLPDLVEHVGSFVSTKWYELGLRLGVNVHILDSIEHDVRECNKAYRKMFQAWLRDHRNGIWNDVIAALRSNSVKEDGVADKLEETMVS